MVFYQILSDIHLERKPHLNKEQDFLSMIKPSADILGLLGDIGSPLVSNLEQFISWASNNYKYVLYIPGNHEYYNNSHIPSADMENMLEELCSQYPNVIFAKNKSLRIDNALFICSTLWSFIPDKHHEFIVNYLNDYRLIYDSNRNPITPKRINTEFLKNILFIREQLDFARKNNLKVVVFTHHTPSLSGTSHPKYNDDPSCHGFSTNINEYIHDFSQIKTWCSGHTHFNYNTTKFGLWIISNQLVSGHSKSICLEV